MLLLAINKFLWLLQVMSHKNSDYLLPSFYLQEILFITLFLFQHIRHHRDRFKRQQGAHLYLPGSYVTSGDGDDEPDGGPWLEWSSPSQCSRTCGGGVSTQYRQCTPGYHCSGPTRRHFSCNTQVSLQDVGRCGQAGL